MGRIAFRGAIAAFVVWTGLCVIDLVLVMRNVLDQAQAMAPGSADIFASAGLSSAVIVHALVWAAVSLVILVFALIVKPSGPAQPAPRSNFGTTGPPPSDAPRR